MKDNKDYFIPTDNNIFIGTPGKSNLQCKFLRFIKTEKEKEYQVHFNLEMRDKVKNDGEFVLENIFNYLKENDMKFETDIQHVQINNCIYPISFYDDMILIDYPNIFKK